MSRGVSRVVAGMGTAPSLMQPRITSYQSGMRGSITNTRSPLPTPWAARNRAARAEDAGRAAKLNRRAPRGARAAPAAPPPARPARPPPQLARLAPRGGLDHVAGVVVGLRDLQPE